MPYRKLKEFVFLRHKSWKSVMNIAFFRWKSVRLWHNLP